MVREVIVAELPKCDFCSAKASYDGKTRDGPWANMCEYHFRLHGIGLGVGKGQRLVEGKATSAKGSILTRKMLEKIEKDLGESVVRLIVGIDTEPEHARNVILYLRMEEEEKEFGETTHQPQEIWLSKAEFLRLGVLLISASSYFEKTLEPGTEESEQEVKVLVKRWKGMRRWLGSS